METDIRALGDVVKGHQLLSQSLPSRGSETTKLLKQLNDLRWHSLFYICNDLWIGPSRDYLEDTKVSSKKVSRKAMAESLLSWRKHDISEAARFVWPHFTMKERSNPIAPWAPPLNLGSSGDVQYNRLTAQDREAAMKELAGEMNYQSAIRVGHVHRFLCQPLDDQDKLEKSLETATVDALKYVCLDINRIPLRPVSGNTTKAMLIEQLIHWVRFPNHITVTN
ncbi:hypothetical protein EV361DRAFT_813132 [Lentinula raphanica]|uniref:Uncharacterized protein n=1 Tax=Lentinula raphanica TaxID=153919 RepID=A0AA38P435_9AGAR|nr:hypothetical protein F5878DRAFT_542252 [Lentinula raphanica]KAJ3963684.1 hypothetical protein EV361DRAFT_813132 [Lentinula raphanica]